MAHSVSNVWNETWKASESARQSGGKPGAVWMLSFESSDVAQLGGLGPAVVNLAKSLARDADVSIFMPGHGRNNDARLREKLHLTEVSGFTSEGERREVDGSSYPYKIGIEEGHFEGISYFLVKGLDQNTSRWLDDRQIYDGEMTYQKMSLFARAMKGYLDFVLKGQPERRPHVIHAHDWHVVPAAVALKQTLTERRMNVPLVFTIHLLIGKELPWHFLSEDWCGIRDEPHYVGVDGTWRLATYTEVWDDLSGRNFERFGAREADFVTSVSKSYLGSDVLPFVGLDLEKKAGFIYNSCDWDERKIVQSILGEHGQRMGSLTSEPKRSAFRRYLLTKALGEAGITLAQKTGEPEVTESPSGLVSAGEPRNMEPFLDDGQLVLTTGRLDRQKGADVLFKAVPEVLEVLPSTKFLLLLVPAFDSGFADSMIQAAAEHRTNVRLVLGRVPEIYGLAHVSADVYAMPSRWEPFGITSLEAMVTGNPVVGTRVGGITETVLDVLDYGENGTGLLVPAEDHRQLARGLISFLMMMKIDEGVRTGAHQDAHRLLDLIPHDRVRELIAENPTTGSMIRENCRVRVERNFRPRSAVQKVIGIYDQASRISGDRLELA